MKKYLTLMLLLAFGSVWAQDVVRDSTAAADTSDTEENVVGGRPQRTNVQQKANVLGAPVYYNLDGSVRTSDGHRGNPRGEYVRPRHHWRNTLDSRYCSYFCEAEGMFGTDDLAIGMNFTYLPNRWGIYGSMLAGLKHNYATLGPALRLSDYDDGLDWHLYGGIAVGDGIGGEVGMRFGAAKDKGNFGWCTGSMGMIFMDGESYVTVGLSLDLTGIVLLTLLLF